MKYVSALHEKMPRYHTYANKTQDPI